MRRQLQPSHLKVPPGPHAFPARNFLGEPAVIINHYSGIEKAIPSLPGFRTSAAFLTSLSANLLIDPDCPSPLITPTAFRLNSFSFQPLPPSTLSLSTSTTTASQYNTHPSPAEFTVMSSPAASAPVKAPEEELPQLTTYTAESEDDRIEGLRLVADSVAQQRQVSSKVMMFHPASLAAYLAVIAIAAQYMLRWYDDKLMLGTTIGGITMTYLIFIRWMTGLYIGIAEDIDLEWLGDDKMIVVKWGEEIIGALVLGWADNDAAKKRGRRRRGKAVVRAWTVRLKYRGKGIGESLLEEAVKVAGERGADGIIFDADHANSKRVLPAIFNGYLDKQEAKAEKALGKVADAKGNFRQRQGSPTWGSR